MNTEQQLIERAEALLDRNTSHYFKFLHPDTRNKMIDFALDFLNQELQRIGEVYVPCTAYEISQLSPNEDGFAYSQKLGWLKKLSLLEVKDLEASDNATMKPNCDAPFNCNKSIEQRKGWEIGDVFTTEFWGATEVCIVSKLTNKHIRFVRLESIRTYETLKKDYCAIEMEWQLFGLINKKFIHKSEWYLEYRLNQN